MPNVVRMAGDSIKAAWKAILHNPIVTKLPPNKELCCSESDFCQSGKNLGMRSQIYLKGIVYTMWPNELWLHFISPFERIKHESFLLREMVLHHNLWIRFNSPLPPLDETFKGATGLKPPLRFPSRGSAPTVQYGRLQHLPLLLSDVGCLGALGRYKDMLHFT